MSKDIRSFFNVISKKSGTDSKPSTSAPKAKKKPVVISDSDDDIIPPTPQKKPKISTAVILDSDDEDSSPKKKSKKAPKSPRIDVKTPKKSPMKLTSVADVFQSTPVKQTEVKVVPKKPPVEESEPKEKKNKKSSKSQKGKSTAETSIHNDSLFEQTLMDLDDNLDDVLLNVVEQYEKNENSNAKENEESNKKKRPRESLGEKKPEKKIKLEHKDSGIEAGPESKEKKIGNAMAYQRYLNRSGPRLHGLKEVPKGKPNCLQNLCFVRTGVLDSLEQEEFEQLIKAHGGRTVTGISKKVNYLVVGDEPGESKIAKAENYKISKISEDELFDLILVKSDMEPKYVNKAVSEDLGIDSEEFLTEYTENGNDHKEETVTKEQKPLKEEKKTEKSHTIKVEHVKKEINPFELPLWQRYKPNSLEQIIGQQNNVAKLKKWLQNWYRNQDPDIKKTLPKPSPWAKSDNGAYFKAALLSGSPGVGKTTTATLVAKSLNLDIVEFNASDTRSKRQLHEHVAQLLSSKTLSGFAKGENSYNLRVLIMDEVDGMSGNEDRGGMQELIQLIKNSKVPIICICNDRNHQKIRSLVNYCFDLRFSKPSIEQISASFKNICSKENINISQQVLTEIISGTGCDVRQSLNHLSMYTLTQKEVTVAEAKKTATNGKKDTILGPWEVIRSVFTESEQKNMSIHDKFGLFFYDYSLSPLFVQENYLAVQPKNCNKAQALRKAALTAESLSMGDFMNAQMRKNNNWSLLPVQALFNSVLPGYHMSGTIKDRINFPAWLGNNSKKNKFSRIASEVQTHTRTTINSSKSAIVLDYMSPLRDIIFAPLLHNGKDGVQDTVNVMKTYNLRREDLDGLVELTQWRAKVNPMSKIDSKVKSALTRLYNKEVNQLPYTLTSSKKKKTAAEDEYGEENEEDDGEEDEDDDLTNNPMIKMKTAASSGKGKKAAGGPSTSKKAEPKKRATASKKK